jgi:polar amino acid transport system permease protein
MLSTSVVSVISANDLTAAGNDVQTRTFTAFEVFLVITGMYFIMSLGFTGLFRFIERLAFKYPLSR